MREFKVLKDRVEKNRYDSMFYRASDHDPLVVASYLGRKWVIYPMGEVSLSYKGNRYYCLSECSDIKTDEELGKAIDNGDLDVFMNNWYEIRPVEQENWKFVEMGLYDDVYGDPYELDKHTLDYHLECEATYG